MPNKDRYKLTEEDKAILTGPSKWREMLDNMVLTEEDRLKYSSNKVKKERKNG